MTHIALINPCPRVHVYLSRVYKGWHLPGQSDPKHLFEIDMDTWTRRHVGAGERQTGLGVAGEKGRNLNMRTTDSYAMRYHGCGAELEIAAGPVDRDDGAGCPRCAAWLALEWRVSRDQGNAYQPGHARELERAANEADMQRRAAA